MADKLGPTGTYPHGKLNQDDEGALNFKVGEREGNVTIEFGGPVTWLAMPPEQAVRFAAVLIAKARLVARRTGTVLTVSL
jgi:hypothetical protein